MRQSVYPVEHFLAVGSANQEYPVTEWHVFHCLSPERNSVLCMCWHLLVDF